LPSNRLSASWCITYTQVGHKLRFSLVLINDSCVVQVRNSTYTIAHLARHCSP